MLFPMRGSGIVGRSSHKQEASSSKIGWGWGENLNEDDVNNITYKEDIEFC